MKQILLSIFIVTLWIGFVSLYSSELHRVGEKRPFAGGDFTQRKEQKQEKDGFIGPEYIEQLAAGHNGVFMSSGSEKEAPIDIEDPDGYTLGDIERYCALTRLCGDRLSTRRQYIMSPLAYNPLVIVECDRALEEADERLQEAHCFCLKDDQVLEVLDGAMMRLSIIYRSKKYCIWEYFYNAICISRACEDLVQGLKFRFPEWLHVSRVRERMYLILGHANIIQQETRFVDEHFARIRHMESILRYGQDTLLDDRNKRALQDGILYLERLERMRFAHLPPGERGFVSSYLLLLQAAARR